MHAKTLTYIHTYKRTSTSAHALIRMHGTLATCDIHADDVQPGVRAAELLVLAGSSGTRCVLPSLLRSRRRSHRPQPRRHPAAKTRRLLFDTSEPGVRMRVC